jgi:Ca-activated chloride channel family protein
MWTDLRGRESDDGNALRIAHAKAAALDFLADVGAADSVGLAVFNTRYWRPLRPTADTRAVADAITEIAKPPKEDAFTELYLSLDRAISEFAEVPGRRVLIVLSDGEDYPYLARTNKPNPDFGAAVSSPSAVIARAVSEGVTCYAVRFGADKDPSLGTVAAESGGTAFDASDGAELSGIYAAIRADVLRETAVDYRAGMQPGDRRYVRASVDGGATWTPARYYYAGTVFGSARERPGALFLIPLMAAAVLWLALWLFKLERPTSRAGISLLYGPSGKRTEIFALSGARTVIGGGAEADITIAGNPSLKASHATILFDEVRGEYTVAAPSDLTVNNRPVAKKRLEPGDVINMAGTVVVFDDTSSSMTSRTTNVRGGTRRALPGARKPRKQ